MHAASASSITRAYARRPSKELPLWQKVHFEPHAIEDDEFEKSPRT